MIYRTPREKIQEYRDNNSLNQSALKVIIEHGMEAYLNQAEALKAKEEYYYEEKDHFLIGSAVDCYITEGELCYLDSYHFSSVKKPGDGMLSVVKYLYDKLLEKHGTIKGTIEEYTEDIYDACNINKYSMHLARPNAKDIEANEKLPDDSPKVVTWKNDSRINKVIREGANYFEDLKAANGKQVLSDEQNQKVNAVINSLTMHPHTEWLFKDGQGIDIFYQLPIYFSIEGVYCKALLDMLRIDHNKQVISPLDIKTHGDYVSKFNRAVRKRRYDLQGAFYKQALIRFLHQLSEMIGKDVTGYRISNFAFVAESTVRQGTPLIFPLSDGLMTLGTVGSEELELKGWMDGITLYKMWQAQDFSMDRMFYMWKGIVPINEKFEYDKHF